MPKASPLTTHLSGSGGMHHFEGSTLMVTTRSGCYPPCRHSRLELRNDLFANGLRQPILTTQDVLRAREASGFTGARPWCKWTRRNMANFVA